MTLVSTVLALAFMPLNMFLYTREWTDEQIEVPYIQNVIIIIGTWFPAFIGIFIRYKSAKVGDWIAKV